jgi:hypothetical protein
MTIKARVDLAHRHFSGLHWLYPGTFIPMKGESLLEPARMALLTKSQAGGGHTGWSAAWEACLWARARDPEKAFLALSKVLTRYSAPNLLGLHPQLMKTGACPTCYGEDTNLRSVKNKEILLVERGMVDKRAAKVSNNAHLTTFQHV